MDIGLVYSKEDPRQKRTRDFVRQFVRERGVNATIFEAVQDVKSPTLIIDGQAITDQRQKARDDERSMFPSLKEIAAALERHAWCL